MSFPFDITTNVCQQTEQKGEKMEIWKSRKEKVLLSFQSIGENVSKVFFPYYYENQSIKNQSIKN